MRFSPSGRIFWLALACSAACRDRAERASPPAAPAPRRAAPATPAGASAAPPELSALLGRPEDLRGSWRAELAEAVPVLPAPEDCPDADGDGFPSALACPALPADRADCDDGDPAVTPGNERWVRPGPFLMGSASELAGADEQPVHVVFLSGYCLDRDEATAADFAAWLAAAGRRPARDDFRRPRADEPDAEALPAEGITWEEARDYCAARGKALPTEAQWEKAARGGCELGGDPRACDPEDLRPYPWGSALPDCRRANHRAFEEGRLHLCAGSALPVGSLPEGTGPYGHRDLAGNVWEYVADAWNPRVYTETPRTDPGGPVGGSAHVLRGGGWSTFGTNMRVANRMSDLVAGSASGVRCARPTVPAIPDPAPPAELVTLAGTVRAASGVLAGKALYVTAFEARGGAAPYPGQSPAAEIRLAPSGAATQPFALPVPKGGVYLVSASLDAGESAPGAPPSGSGGVGTAAGTVEADRDRDGILVVIQPPGQAPPQPGTGGAPFSAGTPPPSRPPPGAPPGSSGRRR